MFANANFSSKRSSKNLCNQPVNIDISTGGSALRMVCSMSHNERAASASLWWFSPVTVVVQHYVFDPYWMTNGASTCTRIGGLDHRCPFLAADQFLQQQRPTTNFGPCKLVASVVLCTKYGPRPNSMYVTATATDLACGFPAASWSPWIRACPSIAESVKLVVRIHDANASTLP